MNQNSRDSFIFYRSFYDALSVLSDEQCGMLFKAVCKYALDRKKPEFAGVEHAIFSLIAPQLDANFRKFKNGKKGGRPKVYNKKPNGNQKESKRKGNDNVNVNVNVNGEGVSDDKNELVSKEEFESVMCNIKQSLRRV